MAFRTYTKPVLLKPAQTAVTSGYTAEEDVKQGQLVKAGGTNPDEVEPSDTDGERVIGVALYDASAGDEVTVVEEAALVRLTDGSGSISADDPLTSHGGTGEEGEVDTAASGDYIIGTARYAGNGNGNDVQVILHPEGFVYGGSPS